MSPLLRFVPLACALILTACGKQGEGERCDINSGINGSLDCEVGLICRSADQIGLPGQVGWALCCPPEDVEPSVNACRAGAQLPMDMTPTEPPPGPDASAPVGDGGT